MTDSRNYQLQGSYTRYEDKLHAGYDSIYGPNRQRNFKTIESAIRAAKKELKMNGHTPIVRTEKERYGKGEYDYHLHCYAEDGREVPFEEPHEFWHVDGVRIVDRVTQKVLWEA